MKNFKNDALTIAEQNNVEGGFFFLRSLWGFGFRRRRSYSYGGGCNTGCNSGCSNNTYRGW